MIAQLLGAIHVQTIANVINYATSLVLTKWPTSLDRLKLWHALSTPVLDWSARLAVMPVVILFCTAALVPFGLVGWCSNTSPDVYQSYRSRIYQTPVIYEYSYDF